MTKTSSDSESQTAPRWNLDTIFPGGSKSKEFQDFRETLRLDLNQARRRAAELPEQLDENCLSDWSSLVLEFQRLGLHLDLAASFAACLIAQDVTDDDANTITGEIQVMLADWEGLKNALQGLFLKQDDAHWQRFLDLPKIKPMGFYLEELRDLAREKMAPELEDLASELAVNGYHAWEYFYNKMSGELKAQFREGDREEALSMLLSSTTLLPS
jgi:oligoendopeptidase F